jgi:hypothetical protein
MISAAEHGLSRLKAMPRWRRIVIYVLISPFVIAVAWATFGLLVLIVLAAGGHS